MGRDITGEELNSVKSWIEELKKNKDNIKHDDVEEREEGVIVDAEVVEKSAGGQKF